ncbi:hypothetical protein [Hominifimenecus sp. rT4P-3]|uniref:hypothetical protein n=1 Tax=Hominifimenecus sp. rT4P-3 TaxID=3242979 RepID=UPI003DA5265B
MSGLILCDSRKVKNPYYVEELGIHLYSGEELSYFIYHNLMLIGEDFLDERLFRFIGQELGMTGLETKLRKWAGQADQAELLLVILQDIHYYSSAELFAFKEQLERLSRSSTAEQMKAKADYLFSMRQYYGALRLYDKIFTLRNDELLSEGFRGNVWFNKGSALAGIFSFDQAAECYVRAYELLQNEEPLRKLFELHLLDELVKLPEGILEHVPAETQFTWKTELEEKKKRARFVGRAAEVEALMEKDNIRRAAGLKDLVQKWKAEYQRSQG